MKEKTMNFEDRVVSVVAQVADVPCEFLAGNLIVECDAATVTRIETALIEALDMGVIVGPRGTGMFALEFV
jgi:hypothetical protein